MLANKYRTWISSIDGLRAIAIIFVILSHTGNAHGLAFGNVGVSLFFSLSGFLMYYVLHRDEQLLGSINYSYFLLRRALRIWPAYFAIIVLAFILAHREAGTNATFASLFTFTLNWKMASFTGWPLPSIAPLWSISVEQQFYLIAPLIYVLLRSKYKLIGCITIFMLTNLGRILYVVIHPEQSGNGGLYYTSFTYADIFLSGSIVAHWFMSGGKISKSLQWVFFIISISMITIILYMWQPIIFPPYHSLSATLPYAFLPFAFILLLFSIVPMTESTFFTYFLTIRPLVIIAKLSYSLYLVHLLVADYIPSNSLYYYLALLIISILLHLIIEKPCLKLKNSIILFYKFRPNKVDMITN